MMVAALQVTSTTNPEMRVLQAKPTSWRSRVSMMGLQDDDELSASEGWI